MCGSQLIPSTGLDDAVAAVASRLHLLLEGTALDLLLALPAEGLEALGEVGVGEMVASVDGVGVEAAEVLGVQLEQGAGEVGGEAEVGGELVGLELVLAGDDVHEQFDDHVHRGEGVVEEQEADDDGALGDEAEGRVQGGVVDEDREEGEDVEEVDLWPKLAGKGWNLDSAGWRMRTWEMAMRRVV